MFETQFSSGIHPFIFYEKCIIRRMLDSALDWMAMISKSTVNEESDEDVSIQEWEENSFSFLLLLYGLMMWCLHRIHIIIYPTVWSWKEMNEGYYMPTVVVSLCMCMPCVFLPQIHLISWKSKMSSILCPGCDDDVDCVDHADDHNDAHADWQTDNNTILLQEEVEGAKRIFWMFLG